MANFRHFCNILKVFGQFLRLLFGIWQSFEPNFANLYAIGQIYIVINGQIEKIIEVSGHTDRDQATAVGKVADLNNIRVVF